MTHIVNTVDVDTNEYEITDSILKDGMSVALISGIKEILDSDLIGVDPVDVETILNFGNAVIYSTQAVGKNRASVAIRQAIAYFMEQNTPLINAQGVMISLAANKSIRMWEVYEALRILTETVSEDTLLLVGAVVREEMDETLRLTIIAVGEALPE